jgi:hypothetical protein
MPTAEIGLQRNLDARLLDIAARRNDRAGANEVSANAVNPKHKPREPAGIQRWLNRSPAADFRLLRGYTASSVYHQLGQFGFQSRSRKYDDFRFTFLQSLQGGDRRRVLR